MGWDGTDGFIGCGVFFKIRAEVGAVLFRVTHAARCGDVSVGWGWALVRPPLAAGAASISNPGKRRILNFECWDPEPDPEF
jgi:hypothetical protein